MTARQGPSAERGGCLLRLRDLAHAWLEAVPRGHSCAQTSAYADLIFAFGLARLEAPAAARELLGRAHAALAALDEAHEWLLGAYEYRVRQALGGQPLAGPLPPEFVERLGSMDRLLRYVVDRLRKHSRILEPDQRVNPYRHWGARISDFERALAELTDLTDCNELAARVEKLLAEVPRGARGNEQKARVLRAGLEAAPRVGEDFARKLLDQAIPCYDGLSKAKELAALMDHAAFLEKAFFVAAHFGRFEYLHPLLARFQQMLQSHNGPEALHALEHLAAQCLPALRKLGMRDEIDQLLRQMADLVLEGQDVKTADFKKPAHGPAALRALLEVAAGWYYFGRDNQADPVLQAARSILLEGVLYPREQTALACAYARALGDAVLDDGLPRLEEMLATLKNVRDTYTTSTHFSVSHLDVLEAVVFATIATCSHP